MNRLPGRFLAGILVALHPSLAIANPPLSTNRGNAEQTRRAFELAKTEYRLGRYRNVIEILEPLVSPTTKVSSQEDLISVYKMLAISSIFNNDQKRADDYLGSILANNPKFDLDPSIDPAEAVAALKALKKRNAVLLRKIQDAQAEALQREHDKRDSEKKELKMLREAIKRKPAVIERTIETRLKWVNFIPFGAGQFQNGQVVKGLVLLGLESLLAATSIGASLAYRIGFPDPTQPGVDVAMATSLIATQLISASLFAAVWLYGIVDGFMYFKETTVSDRRKQSRASLVPRLRIGFPGAVIDMDF